MAIVRTGLVKKEIKALCDRSREVKSQVRRAFKAVQENPAVYPEMETIPAWVRALLPEGACVRKVPITHRRHDYRMIFLHRQAGEDESADFFAVFPRRRNYAEIDWELLGGII